MTVYYNEHDPFAAQWLRNLIAEKVLPAGDVDERDIREVEAYELVGYAQCHFFAGIGVWPYALRQSGWSDDEPIWSGSCPCPPFSQAGKGQTCPACGSRHNICHPRKTGHFICLSCGCDRHADDRHLWPEFARLIRDGKPPKIVGEQVASADGRIWLGAVSADLQTMGYAVAGADICAAGFGGAHIRQRNYFVGLQHSEGDGRIEWRPEPSERGLIGGRASGGLADDDEQQWNGCGNAGPGGRGEFADFSANRGLADDDDARLEGRDECWDGADECFARPVGLASGLVDDDDDGDGREPWERDYSAARQGLSPAAASGDDTARVADALMLGRDAVDWLFCRDGKWRAVEPFTFPLVDAAPARVGRLRAYGNALDAETAIQFCGAVREIVGI